MQPVHDDGQGPDVRLVEKEEADGGTDDIEEFKEEEKVEDVVTHRPPRNKQSRWDVAAIPTK